MYTITLNNKIKTRMKSPITMSIHLIVAAFASCTNKCKILNKHQVLQKISGNVVPQTGLSRAHYGGWFIFKYATRVRYCRSRLYWPTM